MPITTANDLHLVRRLLNDSGLPTEDIIDNDTARFFIFETAGEVVALVGLERHTPHALLRSLFVKPSHRDRGLATQLVTHIRELARDEGHVQLYLLTTTAPDFFRQLGFHTVSRSQTPSAIRQSREFSHLCPKDAVVMYCDL